MRENYTYTGIVIRGNQLGRTIGFPTANLLPGKDIILPVSNGVYAVKVLVRGKMYDGMANIGFRPTIGQSTLTIEAHLFNFSEDLYDQSITIYFYDFIREERKFSGIDELKSQLESDKKTISRILSDRVETDTNTQ